MTPSRFAAVVGFAVGLFVSFEAEARANKCSMACTERYNKCMVKPGTSPADCSAARKSCERACG